jgi:hypothetical protein
MINARGFGNPHQCTRDSTSGDPNPLPRGWGSASGTLLTGSGCSFRRSRFSSCRHVGLTLAGTGGPALAQICHNYRVIALPMVVVGAPDGKATMQQRTRPPLDHREAAARFRLLADIEPWPILYQQFRRLAAHHEELAAGVETPLHD